MNRPPHLNGGFEDYTTADIEWIARQFEIVEPVSVGPFPGRGNINLHTYEVTAGGETYLLQKVNSEVFTMPYRVMKAMVACIEAQNVGLPNCPIPWEPITLVRTRHGAEFLDLTDEHGWSVWRLMVKIPDSVSYKSLGEIPDRADQLELASEVGKGLAIYADLTATLDPAKVEGSLPGYRDTATYYRLFHSVMAGNRTLAEAAPLLPQDPILRASTEQHFLVALDEPEYRRRKFDPELVPLIELALAEEPFALTLWTSLAQGRIRRTTIHGDPKIENFLFSSQTGKVKSLIDLDTIMAFTWLADWGDMIRSLVNVAGEKEEDLSKVVLDVDVYEAVARGFLGSIRGVTDHEVSLMVRAAQIMTLEQAVRFLTDYLRGDTYYRLGPTDPPDLNRTRALVQFRLYDQLIAQGADAEARLGLIYGNR